MKHIQLLLVFILLQTLSFADETNPTKEEVAKLYVATFNRAPDSAGLNYWTNDSGLKLSEIAQSFFDQEETQTLYPSSTAHRDFIASVYQNLFNRDPDSAGWDYWEEQLNIGAFSKNRFIEAVMNGAQGSDSTILVNKTEVGIAFADAGIDDVEEAKSVMSQVTYEYNSVTVVINNVINNYTNQNSAPTANAGADQTVDINSDVTLTGTGNDSDGTIVTYEWKEGSEILAATASFVYTPETLGEHTLVLTVTDDGGLQHSDTVMISVSADTETTDTTILGKWGGSVTQYNDGIYPMTMNLEELVKGETSGTINYPTLKCGGTLTLLDVDNDLYTFREKLTTLNTCIDNGTVTIKKESDKLKWEWFHPNGAKWCDALLEFESTESPVDDGLIAHYKFDGNAQDSSGNGNDGTEYGGVSYVDGVIGKAASFDGLDDVIEVGIHSIHNQSMEQTMSCWFYIDEYQDRIWGSRFSAIAGPAKSRLYLAIKDEKLHFYYGVNDSSGQGEILGTTSVVSLNEWYFATFVSYGDTGVKDLYLNGQKVYSFSGGDNHNMTEGLYTFGGARGYLSETSYKGLVDDLRIYNRALTQSEIQELYNTTN